MLYVKRSLMENEDENRAGLGVNRKDDEYTGYSENEYEDGQYTNGEEEGYSADEDNHLQEDEDNHCEEDETVEDSDEHSESESDSDPDAEQTGTEQNKTRSKRKRGPTRLAKLKKMFNEKGASKKRLKFDRYGRIKTRDAADFSSYLGDLVRERIGLTVTEWKEVTPDQRQMLWDTILVMFHYKFGYLICQFYFNFNTGIDQERHILHADSLQNLGFKEEVCDFQSCSSIKELPEKSLP